MSCLSRVAREATAVITVVSSYHISTFGSGHHAEQQASLLNNTRARQGKGRQGKERRCLTLSWDLAILL